MSSLVRAVIGQASNLKYLKVPSWFEGLNFIASAHLPQCGPWLSALQVQKSIFVNIKEIESLQVETHSPQAHEVDKRSLSDL